MTGEIVIDISPKEKYLPLYQHPAPVVDLWGGRGRGGSHEATLYALYRFTRPDYCRIAFVRKILNDVRHSLWQDFKDRIEECNVSSDDYRMADHAMEATYLPTGNQVRCFGVKAEGGRTAKLKSLAGYNLVIIEECDELSEDENNQLDDSLRTKKGDIPPMVIRVFNPPGRGHWLWKNYNLVESHVPGYWKAEMKANINMLSVFGTYHSNRKNLDPGKVEKWESYKHTNPEYFYTIIEGLISEGQRGRVFSGWRPITNDEFIAIDAKSVFGLDFGFSESPMGLVEIKMVKNRLYGRQHIYKPMTLKELAFEMCRLGITGSDKIIADSADPISINKLRTGWKDLTEEELEKYPQAKKGFHILGAIKGPGSITFGINVLKDLEIFIVDTSDDYWNEYREYKWALDKDKNPTDMPEDKSNHLIDPTRYVATAKGRLF